VRGQAAGREASPSLVGAVAGFELRQHLSSPVFAIVVTISGLMVFGSLTIERIQIGPVREGARNSAEAIAQIHLVWSLFFLFTATVFTSDAVLRDDATRFGPIIRSTPIRKRDYLLGRFGGSFLATIAAFLSVPAGIWLATFAPWLDPARLVPTRLGDYVFAFTILALPNLFVASALFFALATVTRSIWAAYLGAVGLLVAYGLGTESAAGSSLGPVAAILEPFGFAALASGGPAGWVLAANRLVWIAIGVAALGWTLARFEIREPVRPGRTEPSHDPHPHRRSRRGRCPDPASAPAQRWLSSRPGRGWRPVSLSAAPSSSCSSFSDPRTPPRRSGRLAARAASRRLPQSPGSRPRSGLSPSRSSSATRARSCGASAIGACTSSSAQARSRIGLCSARRPPRWPP
jgi:hypothetical protein